jgi:hypothetical protein
VTKATVQGNPARLARWASCTDEPARHWSTEMAQRRGRIATACNPLGNIDGSKPFGGRKGLRRLERAAEQLHTKTEVN